MKENRQKKSRKRFLLIAVAVSLAVVIGLLSAGYFTVDKAFSVLTESMYSSSVTQQQEEISLSENKATGTLPPLPSGEPSSGADVQQKGAQQSTSAPQKDVLDKAKEKFGITSSLKFSTETVKKLEKSVSLGDKLAVMAIISKSLSTQDYQKLLAMTGGGITRDEISQAYSILSKSLSGSDKRKIYEYYSKYAYLLGDN